MEKSALWKAAHQDLIVHDAVRRWIGISGFLLLTAAGAYLYIPLPGTPVPITLQTFFVLLAAVILRRKDGVLAMGIYAGLGAAGIPLFSAVQGGLFKLLGPTGGYIIGFLFACLAVEPLREFLRRLSRREFFSAAAAMAAGIAVIYACGGLWLRFLLGLSWKEVWLVGAAPFVFADALKVFFAAFIYRQSGARVKSMFQ